MKGLRTQEDDNFIRFFEIVQEAAKKIGMVFFLDCEDGNDAIIDGIEVCDLAGWLIPVAQANEFEKVWKDNKEDDAWSDFFTTTGWKNERELNIIFEK